MSGDELRHLSNYSEQEFIVILLVLEKQEFIERNCESGLLSSFCSGTQSLFC